VIVQGDVFFTRAKKLPEGVKPVGKRARGYVIAEGEATGHAHVIQDDIELYEKDGILFVKTSKDVSVHHEEHLPVTLGAGIWKVGIVREFDPFLQEYRKVTD